MEAGRRGSALEAVDQVLARVLATEPVVHAYVQVDAHGARAAARVLDSSSARAPLRGEAGDLGLCGVPFAVKDVLDVAGMPTRCGRRGHAERTASEDAVVVRRLRDAGAILVGKHVTHELTCGLDEPPTRNPWDLSCYPGGSSAGGGVSVAVGSASFALGTDAAGSVRIPAAMSGVVGFKPTYGRISTEGLAREATAPSIDHVGILARTAVDVARVFAAIGEERVGDELGTLELGVRGLRLGSLVAGSGPLQAPEPAVRQAFRAACGRLTNAGARLVEIDVPSFGLASGAVSTLFAAELAAGNRAALDGCSQQYHPDVRRLLRAGLDTAPAQLEVAACVRAQLRTEIEDAFRELHLDALVTPTAPRAAMPLTELRPSSDLATIVTYTCAFNLTGQPAISVPCGFTPSGMPIGLQIAGVRAGDATVLRIASAYQRLTTWHRQRPVLPSFCTGPGEVDRGRGSAIDGDADTADMSRFV